MQGVSKCVCGGGGGGTVHIWGNGSLRDRSITGGETLISEGYDYNGRRDINI